MKVDIFVVILPKMLRRMLFMIKLHFGKKEKDCPELML